MAHQLTSMDGLDIPTIKAAVRGWILAHTLSAPLTVEWVMFELGMTRRQARLGLAEAEAAGIVQRDGTAEFTRTSMPPRT